MKGRERANGDSWGRGGGVGRDLVAEKGVEGLGVEGKERAPEFS